MLKVTPQKKSRTERSINLSGHFTGPLVPIFQKKIVSYKGRIILALWAGPRPVETIYCLRKPREHHLAIQVQHLAIYLVNELLKGFPHRLVAFPKFAGTIDHTFKCHTTNELNVLEETVII